MLGPEIGIVISSSDPTLAESIAGTLDFVWIDLEHGALDVQDVQVLTLATQAIGCSAFVRLPSWDSDRLAAVLDCGVDGVVAPMIETPSQAESLVDRLRYPPRGHRGFGPRRAGSYGRSSAFWESPDVLCVAMIETPNAVDQVDRIAAVDGITGVVLGSADLSLASGNPGNQAASAIRDSIRRLEEAASSAGVACGIATGENPETIAQLITYHTSFVVYSVDIRLYARAVDEAARKLREVLSYRPQKVIDPKGQALTETSDG